MEGTALSIKTKIRHLFFVAAARNKNPRCCGLRWRSSEL